MKDPKSFGVPGKKVAISAPASNGTTIMPPGTDSMVRLIGICMSDVLPAHFAHLPFLIGWRTKNSDGLASSVA